MPALPVIRDPVLVDLIADLRFAPPRTLRTHIDRAAALASDVQADGSYPEEWVVFRVTGYRPESDAARISDGAALLRDLSAFVEALCDHADLHEDELPEDACSSSELCARWGISTPTLSRYRRQGLVARRVRMPNGRHRLAFTADALAAFEARRSSSLSRARRFKRHSEATVRDAVERAVALHQGGERSLAAAARRVAREIDVPPETVREMLLRDESVVARFGHRGPAGERERRFVDRALDRGLDPERVAAHLGRPTAAIRRIGLLARADRLRRWTGEMPEHPDWAEALEGTLDLPPARLEIGAPPTTSLRALLDALRSTPTVARDVEHARAAAFRVLCARAARAAASLNASSPSATAVDLAETDLRWASRLKIELVRGELGLIGRALDDRFPDLESWSASDIALITTAAIRGVGDAVDRFAPPDPRAARAGGLGHRLAGPAGIAVSKVIAIWHRSRTGDGAESARSAAKRVASGERVREWSLDLDPWSARLLPPASASLWDDGVVERIGPQDADLLSRRFGVRGHLPHAAGDLARWLGLPRVRSAVRERAAIRSLRAAVRTMPS